MKKSLLIISTTVLIILMIGTAIGYTLYTKRPQPEKVFKAYLMKQADSTRMSLSQSLKGTGATGVAVGTIDITNKSYRVNANIKCVAKTNSSNTKLSADVQINNDKIYTRFNSVSGTYKSADSAVIDLKHAYSKVVGKWYTLDANSIAYKSQLDSGIYAQNSGLLAPSYDTEKIVDGLLKDNVITYTSYAKDGANYVFKISADRTAYEQFLAKFIPNLSNADLVAEEIFGDGSEYSSQITVNEEGDYVKEVLQIENTCNDLVQVVIGEEPDNSASKLSSVAKPIDESKVKLPQVTKPTAIKNIAKDIQY